MMDIWVVLVAGVLAGVGVGFLVVMMGLLWLAGGVGSMIQ